MNPFRTLGLDRNADESAIKRAYAKLLKTTRPDDDPVGFQRLNDAYRSALAQAANATPEARDRNEDSPGPTGMFPVDFRYEGNRQVAVEPVQIPLPVAVEAPDTLIQPSLPATATKPDFDASGFIRQLHEFASNHEASAIRQWLLADQNLFSIGLKARLAPQLVDNLLELAPLPPQKLDAILGFFELDQVTLPDPALRPYIQQLQQHSADAFPGLAPVTFRPRSVQTEGSGNSRYAIWLVLILVAVLRLCGAATSS